MISDKMLYCHKCDEIARFAGSIGGLTICVCHKHAMGKEDTMEKIVYKIDGPPPVIAKWVTDWCGVVTAKCPRCDHVVETRERRVTCICKTELTMPRER